MSQQKSLNTSNETPKERRKKTASAHKNGLVLAGCVLVIATVVVISHTPDNRILIKTSNKTLSTLVADTEVLREKGLSDRISLGRNDSMLFVFESDSYSGFWMKDMKFPIDIVWLDASKKIVSIKQNATPDSYPKVYYPSAPSRYVIELVSARANELDIDVGTTLNW